MHWLVGADFPGSAAQLGLAPKGRLPLVKLGETICRWGIQETFNLSKAVIQAKHLFY